MISAFLPIQKPAIFQIAGRKKIAMEKSLALVAQHAAFKEGVMKIWQPKGVGNDPPSLTIKEVNLHLMGSNEVLVLPVYTNTKVFEIKALLIERLSANPDQLRLVQKQGTSFRVQQDHEEIARTVTLHGIKSFKRVEAAEKTGEAKPFFFGWRDFRKFPAESFWFCDLGTSNFGTKSVKFSNPKSKRHFCVDQFSHEFWGVPCKKLDTDPQVLSYPNKINTQLQQKTWPFIPPKTGNKITARPVMNFRIWSLVLVTLDWNWQWLGSWMAIATGLVDGFWRFLGVLVIFSGQISSRPKRRPMGPPKWWVY